MKNLFRTIPNTECSYLHWIERVAERTREFRVVLSSLEVLINVAFDRFFSFPAKPIIQLVNFHIGA